MILTHKTMIDLGFSFRDAAGKPVDHDEEITLTEIDLGEYVYTDGLFQLAIDGSKVIEDGPTVADIVKMLIRSAHVPNEETFLSRLFGTRTVLLHEGDPYPEPNSNPFPAPRKATGSPSGLFPAPKVKS